MHETRRARDPDARVPHAAARAGIALALVLLAGALALWHSRARDDAPVTRAAGRDAAAALVARAASPPAVPPASPPPRSDAAPRPGPSAGGDAARPDWSLWLEAAHAGDAIAACRLAALLDDCRLAREVERMIETELSIAASQRDESAEDLHGIAALEAGVDPLRARCAALPDALHAQAWQHLLQAAVAGHEASILRFVLDPPLDALSGSGRDAAIEAYRRNADLFLASLLQRTSPDALVLAFRSAQGEEFLAGVPARMPDPEAVVRWGSALLVLYGDDPAIQIGVDAALARLDARTAAKAQADGQRLVLPFLQRQRDATASPAGPGDECRQGWPGRE